MKIRITCFLLLLFSLGFFTSSAQNPDNEGIIDADNTTTNPFYPSPSDGSGVDVYFYNSHEYDTTFDVNGHPYSQPMETKWSHSTTFFKGKVKADGDFELDRVDGKYVKGRPGADDIIIFLDLFTRGAHRLYIDEDVECRRIVFSTTNNDSDNYGSPIKLIINPSRKVEVKDGFFYDTHRIVRSEAFLEILENATLITGSLVTNDTYNTNYEGLDFTGINHSFNEYFNHHQPGGGAPRSVVYCAPSSTVILRPRDDADVVVETKQIYLPEVLLGTYPNVGVVGTGYGHLRLEKGGEDCVEVLTHNTIGVETITVKSSLYIDECVSLDASAEEILIDCESAVLENNGNIDPPDKVHCIDPTQVINVWNFEGEYGSIIVDQPLITYNFINVEIMDSLVLKESKALNIIISPIKIKSTDEKTAFVIPRFENYTDLNVTLILTSETFEIERHLNTKTDPKRTEMWHYLGAMTKGHTMTTWADVMRTGIYDNGKSSVKTYSESSYAKGEPQYTFVRDWSMALPPAGVGFRNFFFQEGDSPDDKAVIKADGSGHYSEIGELNLEEKIDVDVYFTPFEDDSESGHNLLANPFPYPLSWRKVFEENQDKLKPLLLLANSYDLSFSVYYYSNDLGEVFTNNPSESYENTDLSIAPGQAFIVKTLDGTDFNNTDRKSTIEVGRSMRYKEADAPVVTKNYRVRNTSQSVYQKCRLALYQQGKEGQAFQTVFIFADQFHEEYVEGEDVQMANSSSPKLGSRVSTESGDAHLALNFLPFPQTSHIVPIDFANMKEGTFEIRLEDFKSLLKEQSIRLYDKKREQFIDLKNDTFSFNVESGESQILDRFELYLQKIDVLPDVVASLPVELRTPVDSIVVVPITLSNVGGLASFEWEVLWEEQQLEFLGMETDWEQVEIVATENGAKLLWHSTDDQIGDRKSQEKFNFRFRVLNEEGSSVKVEHGFFEGRIDEEGPLLETGFVIDSSWVNPLKNVNLSIVPIPHLGILPDALKLEVSSGNRTLLLNNQTGMLDLNAIEGEQLTFRARVDHAFSEYVDIADYVLFNYLQELPQQILYDQFITMDINDDHEINTEDLEAIVDQILRRSSNEFSTAWKFYPEDYFLPSENASSQEPSQWTHSVSSRDNEIRFFAIQKGNLHQEGYTVEKPSGLKEVTINIIETVEGNGDFIIELNGESNERIKGLQATITWDSQYFEWMNGEFLVGEGMINEEKKDLGKLTFLWDTQNPSYQNESFLKFRFQPKSDKVGGLDFQLNDSQIPMKAVSDQLEFLNIDTHKQKSEELEMRIAPNPVKDIFSVQIISKDDIAGRVELYSLEGELFRSEEVQAENGMAIVRWSRQSLSSGLYLVRFQTNGLVKTNKLMLY